MGPTESRSVGVLRGTRTLRQVSEETGLSVTTLRAAAAGERLPTWPVTRQFAAGCGGSEDFVRELWEDACAAGGRPLPGGDPPEFGMPDPGAATTVEDFVAMLKLLRTWAGDPSLAELNKRSGGLGSLPPSTVSDMLRNQHRLPRLDLVLGFVLACGLNEDQATAWERSWTVLRALESIPGSQGSGHVPPQLAPWRGQARGHSAPRSLLVWASGARPEILARCPTDRGTYTALGSTILLSATLATLSAAYALHTTVGAPLIAAGLVGIVGGGILMSLDRTLVVSIQRGRGPRNLLAVIPRLALGLILGAVISVPVIMEIFHADINAELVLVQAQESDRYASLMPNSAVGTQIKTLQAQLNDEQQAAKSFYGQWQCQEFGHPFCTQKGQDPGPQQGYKSTSAAISAINSKLGVLQNEESAISNTDERVALSDNGLIASLTAFEDAADSSGTIRDVQILFFALFATIEFLPVIVRMLNIAGPQNTYEKILRMQELADIRAASQHSGTASQGRKPAN